VSTNSQEIFRAAALEQLSSPEQLDQLIDVTRPADWIGALIIGVSLLALLAWGVVGRIPTRASGEGILVSDAGGVVDAISAGPGRIDSVDVAVGDRVSKGQVIARVLQTDAEQRLRDAAEALKEREREQDELAAAIKRELEIKAADMAAQKTGLGQGIAAALDHAAYLVKEIAGVEGLNAKGLVTLRELEGLRADLAATRQRITDAQNEIQRLDGQIRETETQRDLDRLAQEFKVNEARRETGALAGAIARNSKLLSPIDGRVFEIKVSAGGVLAAGTPVAAIEPEGASLEAIVYVPADRGKTIEPGMEVRIEPSAIKREEYGTMLGKVASVSEFPVTPEGMGAVLHNDALVRRFSLAGAPYAVRIALEPDGANVSGYRWSSGRGPPIRLSAGTLARAEVTTREQPPLDLVVPILKRVSGTGG
jgi:HlyD family secretion protein